MIMFSLLLLCLVSSNQAFDLFKGHPNLGPQSSIGGRRFKHKSRNVDALGGIVDLEYDVRVGQHVRTLESIPGLSHITCGNQMTTLELRFDSPRAFQKFDLAETTKFVGGVQWGCLVPNVKGDLGLNTHDGQEGIDLDDEFDDQQPDLVVGPVYALVKKTLATYENGLLLQVESFHFHEAFDSAEIHFVSRPAPLEKLRERAMKKANRQGKRDVGDYPLQLDRHLEGDLFNFNYDPVENRALRANMTVFPNMFGLQLVCVECYSYLHSTIEFHMIVSREPWGLPQLEALRLYISGEFGLHMKMLWTMSYEFGFQVFSKKLMPDLPLPPINFVVGPVPINLTPVLILKLNIGLRVRGIVQIGHGMTTKQEFGVGVQYRRGTGRPQMLTHAAPQFDIFPVTGSIADPDRTAIGATLVPGMQIKLWNVVPITFAIKPMGGILFHRHRCPAGKIYYTLLGKLDIEAGLAAISVSIPGTSFSFDVALEGGLPYSLVATPITYRDLKCGVCAGCIGLRPSLDGERISLPLTATPVDLDSMSVDAEADRRCGALATCGLCNTDPTCMWCQNGGKESRNPIKGLCAARALVCEKDGTTCLPGASIRFPRGVQPGQCSAAPQCPEPFVVEEVVYPVPGTKVGPGGRVAIKWHGSAVGSVEMRYSRVGDVGTLDRRRQVARQCQAAATCGDCADAGCVWCSTGQVCGESAEQCRIYGDLSVIKNRESCPLCDGTSCSRCLAENGCSWCPGSAGTGAEFCALSGTDLALSCASASASELQTDPNTCDDRNSAVAASLRFSCSNFFTCDRCRADARCGWCGSSCGDIATCGTHTEECPMDIKAPPAPEGTKWFGGAGLPETSVANDLRFTWFVPRALASGNYQVLVYDKDRPAEHAVSHMISIVDAEWRVEGPFPSCPGGCTIGANAGSVTRKVGCYRVNSNEELLSSACRVDERPLSSITCPERECPPTCPSVCAIGRPQCKDGKCVAGEISCDPSCCPRDCGCDEAKWIVEPETECSASCTGTRKLKRAGCYGMSGRCPTEACGSQTIEQAIPGYIDETTQRCDARGVCNMLQLTAGEWGECSRDCGGGGTQTREFVCRELDERGAIVLDIERCLSAKVGVAVDDADGETRVQIPNSLADLVTTRSCGGQPCPDTLLSMSLVGEEDVVLVMGDHQESERTTATNEQFGVAPTQREVTVSWTGGRKYATVVIERFDGEISKGSSQEECVLAAKWVPVATLTPEQVEAASKMTASQSKGSVGRRFTWKPETMVPQRTRLRVRVEGTVNRATTAPFSLTRSTNYVVTNGDGSMLMDKADTMLLYGQLTNAVIRVGDKEGSTHTWVGEVRGVTLVPDESFGASVYVPGTRFVVQADNQQLLTVQLPEAQHASWVDAEVTRTLTLPCANGQCGIDVEFVVTSPHCADVINPDLSLAGNVDVGLTAAPQINLPMPCSPNTRKCLDGTVHPLYPPECKASCPEDVKGEPEEEKSNIGWIVGFSLLGVCLVVAVGGAFVALRLRKKKAEFA